MSYKALSNKLVLIVEDDPINNELLVFLLKKVNMRSLSAYTGQEGIELFNANPDIDLVLMDIRLPGMNGYEITQKLKEIKPSIPIIAQTALALPDDEEKCYNAGCDYVLVMEKP